MDNVSIEGIVLDVMMHSLELPEGACRAARWRDTPEWDSFAFVEIIAELEDRLDYVVSEADLEKVTDFPSLVSVVCDQLTE